MICDVGLNKLTGLMREAKEAHTRFEAAQGEDPHWELFYASYIRSRLYAMDPEDAYHTAVIDVLGSSGL